MRGLGEGPLVRSIKPLNGWRVFAGEVGVIVLGVLLALGAQKVIQDVQTRSEVRTFRETIDSEIAFNLWVYSYRDAQTDCVAQRTGEILAWLDRAGEGERVGLADASKPLTFSLYRSAWDNRDGDVFAALPKKARLKYAEFYDELANTTLNAARERATWETLALYEQPGPLSIDDRRVLRRASKLAALVNESNHENRTTSVNIARALGIGARRPDGMLPKELAALRRCPSVTGVPE